MFQGAAPEPGSDARIIWSDLSASTDYEVRVWGAGGCPSSGENSTPITRTRVTTLPPPTATPTATPTGTPSPTPTPVPALSRFEAAVDPGGNLSVIIDGVPSTVAEVQWREENGDWAVVAAGAINGSAPVATGAVAGDRLHVRARPGPDAEDWQRVRVTVPVVHVYGARAWVDVVREGDALVMLEVGLDGGGDEESGDAPELSHLLWWSVAGAAAQGPRFYALHPGLDACVGVNCSRPDGQGRGLVTIYHRSRPTSLEGEEVTVSAPSWASVLSSGVTLVVAASEGRTGPTMQDVLRDALIRIEREWGISLITGGGTLSEIGIDYVDAVLPNAALFPIHPLYPVHRQADPGPTPTAGPPPTPTPGASSIDRAFEQVARDTGTSVSLLRELAIVAMIAGMVGIMPKQTNRRVGLALAVVGGIAWALAVGWAGALTMQALLVAGIVVIFRRVTRDVPV